MTPDDPAVLDLLRRCRVARLATLSRTGRPSVTPLYFVRMNACIWLGTASWTLAAREAAADPRVSLLFEAESAPPGRPILRITGRAAVRTDPEAQRAYALRAAFKYVLTPGGLLNALAHWRQFSLRRAYYAQSAAKGPACVIEVTPERVEILEPVNDSGAH